jgi:hypothetical protein
MKKIVIISSAVLSLIFGIAVPAYAQQEQKNEKQDQPRQQQKAKEQAKPDQQHAQPPQNQEKQQHQNQSNHEEQAQHQQEQNQSKQQQQHVQQQQNQDRQQQQAQQQKQNQNKQQQQHAPQQQNAYNQQQNQHPQQQQYPQHSQDQRRIEQSTWQGHRAGNWQSDHRSWQQRGGYDGYHIPDDRYRGYFGPQHWFRIYGRPFAVYGGYPRFQYQGYWITLLDPWPEYWSNDWYDNDDVYVSYGNDGYYLYNRRYPGTGIAISISM